jgi:hypothetical protein
VPHRHTIRTRVAPGLRGAPVGRAGQLERQWARNFPTAPRFELSAWGAGVGVIRLSGRFSRWWKRYADLTVPYTVGLAIATWIPFTVFSWIPFTPTIAKPGAASELGALVALFGLWPAHLRLGPRCRQIRWTFKHAKVILKKMHRVGGFEPLPHVFNVVEKAHIMVYDVQLAEGTDPQLWTKQRRPLAVSFRKPVDFVPLTDHHWRIIVTKHDLLSRPPAYDWNIGCDYSHIWCGVDWNGDLFTAPLFEAHWLVGGETRAGKSSFLNAVLCQIIRLPHVKLKFIDPQHGISFSRWWEFGEVAKTAEAGVLMLEREVAALAARGAWMGENHLSLVPPSADTPLHVIIIDEAAQLLAHPDKQLQKRSEAALHNLTATGLKAGFTVVMATQDPRDALIPTEISNQFSHRFGMSCKTWQQSNVILGGALAGAGWNLAEVPPHQPGRGIYADGTDIRRCRFFGLLGHDLPAFIDQHRPDIPHVHEATLPSGIVLRDMPLPGPSVEKRVEDGSLSWTTGDRVTDVKIMLDAAGSRGVLSAEVALRFGISQRQAGRDLRTAGAELCGGRWYWPDVCPARVPVGSS